MAAIQPDSTILIFHGMPMDPSYQDTLYFANKGSQYSFFSGNSNPYLKYTYSTQSYQRVHSGVFEANQKADDLYDCNYMAFKNTAYGTKWFFAFITQVEYRNNENCYVYYELDYIQTYLYDGAILEQCMIEREHTPTDFIGEHILPEPVECGDYIFSGYASLTTGATLAGAYIAVVICESTTTSSPIPGGIFDGIFCGASVKIFHTGANTGILDYLQDYITTPESVVGLYMIPKMCIGNTSVPDAGLDFPSGSTGQSMIIQEPAPSLNDTFGNYTPKNMKLYSYPYNFFQANTPDGNTLQIRYEFCHNLTPSFLLKSCVMAPVQVKLSPLYYKGSGTELNHQYTNESLVLTGYPMCGWSYDSYTAWQAMNTVPMLVNAGMSVVSEGASGRLSGVAGTVGSVFSETYRAKKAEGVPNGNYASGNIDYSSQNMQFYGGRCHITEEFAKMIDGYFTEFGYRVNRLGTPSINNRPHYTYVKTMGCKVKGLAPAEATTAIERIFDAGITFWVTPSEVGNYSVNNAPVSN